MTHCMKLYDKVRIDHFRGFDEYWSVPYGDKTAENGKWEKGPGIELFEVLEEKIKDLDVITSRSLIFSSRTSNNSIPGPFSHFPFSAVLSP